MCGIVGIATAANNGFSAKEADMFFNMLYLDALRGYDSTGVFGVDKHKNVQIHKEASQAGIFMQDKTVHNFRTELVRNGLFAVGHNRAATRGEVVDKNAHPFWVDDKIVLVQNGTWRGSHSHIKDTAVDTEALTHIIAENDDVEEALSKINAAYALTWFNTKTGKLHIVRNYERPMYLAETERGSLMWASEGLFIQFAAARNDVKLKDKPVILDPHTLITLEISGNGWKRSTEKVNPFRSFVETEPTNDDTWENWCNHLMGRRSPAANDCPPSSVVRLPAPPTRTPTQDTHMIERTFFEEALENLDHDNEVFFKDKNEALKFADTARGVWLADYKKTFPVELVDCIPANKHPFCTSWHVYGSIITDENDPMSRLLVHWFLYNKTAKEAQDYVTENFFNVTIANIRIHTYNDKLTLVMAGCSDHISVPLNNGVVQ